MDIFKGIGDFFGGLFGQKKKREDEQQQPQQQSAVSFNSTPKLGYNFVNNLSNPHSTATAKRICEEFGGLKPSETGAACATTATSEPRAGTSTVSK